MRTTSPLQETGAKSRAPFAVASLVLGILGVVPLGPLAGVPAVICGHVSLHSTKKANLSGKGIAIAGLVLGYGSLVLYTLIVIGIWNVTRDIMAPGGLHEAAKAGDISQVELLLKSGADINEAKAFGTPLHFAAGFGQPEMVEYLIAHGGELDAWVDPIGTPLITAAGANRLECVKVLLKHGADVNATGASTVKETALHWAALHGYVDVMKVLIEDGADVNAKDVVGRTPLDTARSGGQEEAARLLRAAGGK